MVDNQGQLVLSSVRTVRLSRGVSKLQATGTRTNTQRAHLRPNTERHLSVTVGGYYCWHTHTHALTHTRAGTLCLAESVFITQKIHTRTGLCTDEWKWECVYLSSRAYFACCVNTACPFCQEGCLRVIFSLIYRHMINNADIDQAHMVIYWRKNSGVLRRWYIDSKLLCNM